jgi:crossover junction endodeoxyribonuclease RuvC
VIAIGVDPGLSGALAVYDSETHALEVYDTPTLNLARNGKNKREVDHYALARIVDEITGRHRHAQAFVELVGAMPGQGVSSVFAFGKSYGVIIGVLAANFLPITFVSPVVWKRALKVPKAKDGSRARASALFPRDAGRWSRVKDDGRAEAAMIALHGAQVSGEIGRAA